MHLFIYGTLAPNQPNEHILKPLNGTWKKASVRGKLYASGWGAALGYPGIVLTPDGEGDEVTGLVFTSPLLQEHLAMLDEFEGEGYRRVTTTATLDNGECVDTFIYELAQVD